MKKLVDRKLYEALLTVIQVSGPLYVYEICSEHKEATIGL